MKNRGHKIKFRGGRDANKMLMRKLVSNFVLWGRMDTTKQKAKATQSIVERLVTKAKTHTEADQNYILKHIIDRSAMRILIDVIAPQLTRVKYGYTKVVNRGIRQTDGAEKASLEWAYPVTKENKITEKKVVGEIKSKA
jgi:large subunit ribosomal protein L17